MLKSIYISNYALISSLNISFDGGFSVITGETGAGKSIIMGALGLILGQRADNKVIKPNEEKCVVEAQFDIASYKHLNDFFESNELDNDGKICLVRRELTGSGKSRAFINDTPVALNVLKDLTGKLIDIHSQHENLLLSNTTYQLEVLDTVARNQSEKLAYQTDFHAWKSKEKELEQLRRESLRAGAEIDFIRFQYNQLEEAKLVENELAELESEHTTLSHAEEIKSELNKTTGFLNDDDAVLSRLKEATAAFSKICRFIPDGEAKYERIYSGYIDLKDLCVELEALQDRFEFNPSRMEWVETRLSEIYALLKKFKVNDIAALISKKQEFETVLHHIDSFDEELARLQKELDLAMAQLVGAGKKLTFSRRKQIPQIENYLKEQLTQLGMPNIQFEIRLNETEHFTENGNDEVKFYFSANKNRPLQPVELIASGGEISRLMLSVKSLIADKSDLPTIIFDEIDTGVSGEIAHRMGEIMQTMSQSMQVITITHLPQIAARGKNQYRVYKDDSGSQTETFISRLSRQERVEEIASMLSGKDRGEAAIRNAEELLKDMN